MKLRTLLLACGASLALAGIASAQSPMPPGYRALPPFRIAAIVRASGFDPLFRPLRQGDAYVLRAVGRNDVEYRLVIDAYTGRTMSVRATGARGAPVYGPYGGPVYGRIFGPHDERFDDGYGGARRRPVPPRVVTHTPPPRPSTPPTTQASTPAQLALPTPGSSTTQAPLPRPRPYVMEATSSIPVDSAKSAAPQNAPPPPPAPQNPVPASAAPSAPPAGTPPNNGGTSMPPIAPLD